MLPIWGEFVRNLAACLQFRAKPCSVVTIREDIHQVLVDPAIQKHKAPLRSLLVLIGVPLSHTRSKGPGVAKWGALQKHYGVVIHYPLPWRSFFSTTRLVWSSGVGGG